MVHQSLCWASGIWCVKRINCVNHEIRPNRPNGPVGESSTSTSTCPTKVGPILSHGLPVGTKARTCPSRFKKLVLQAKEACPASLGGLFSRSGWLPQQVWGGLLYKERRQDLTTIKSPNILLRSRYA